MLVIQDQHAQQGARTGGVDLTGGTDGTQSRTTKTIQINGSSMNVPPELQACGKPDMFVA